MKKNILISIGAIFIAVLAISLWQVRKMENQMQELSPGQQEELAVSVPQQPQAFPRPALKPGNPADYGMVITDESVTASTQEDWNKIISEKIAAAKAQSSPEDWARLNKTIAEDPQKTEDKLKRIEEEMAKCRAALKNNPGDQDTQDKLQRLMMLKSIASGFKENK
jgi:hypothetical protein